MDLTPTTLLEGMHVADYMPREEVRTMHSELFELTSDVVMGERIAPHLIRTQLGVLRPRPKAAIDSTLSRTKQFGQRVQHTLAALLGPRYTLEVVTATAIDEELGWYLALDNVLFGHLFVTKSNKWWRIENSYTENDLNTFLRHDAIVYDEVPVREARERREHLNGLLTNLLPPEPEKPENEIFIGGGGWARADD